MTREELAAAVRAVVSRARCFPRWNSLGEYRIVITKAPEGYLREVDALPTDPGYQDAMEAAEIERPQVLADLEAEARRW